MMLLSSSVGHDGDRVQLTSPPTIFKEATSVSFRYIITTSVMSSLSSTSMSATTSPSSINNTTISLELYQLSLLGVPSSLLHRVSVSALNEWVTVKVCVPAGRYSLMFVGTLGQPYSYDIGLDDVTIDNSPCSIHLASSTGLCQHTC